MKSLERYCLERLVTIEDYEKEIEEEKELHIVEECIAESTLDIWCKNNILHPKLIQYEIHKCFILRFELAFSCFINPVVDLYHYNLKDIVCLNKDDEVTENNIEQCFESGTWIDKRISSGFIRLVTFENDEWYIKY